MHQSPSLFHKLHYELPFYIYYILYIILGHFCQYWDTFAYSFKKIPCYKKFAAGTNKSKILTLIINIYFFFYQPMIQTICNILHLKHFTIRLKFLCYLNKSCFMHFLAINSNKNFLWQDV